MKKFIGSKEFYKRVLYITIPIMVQNGITNFVNLLDNIMVGQIGTDQMSGVAIINQLIFVFNISVFGGLSGPGIFGAQYFGKNDQNGIRNVFRAKMWIMIFILLAAIATFSTNGENLILKFLHSGGDTGNTEATLHYAKLYLNVIMFEMFPFALNQCYVSTLREKGETMIPMVAGIIAVGVNLGLNYILIFGHFHAPALGVEGAAIATVTARYVECFIIIFWTHIHSSSNPYIIGVYRSARVPIALIKKILIKGSPLMINEFFWASGMTMMSQCYSTRGLATVAAININNTINNLFNVVFIALGSAVAIIVGQLLGANKMEEAKDCDNKLIAFSVTCCIGIGLVMIASSSFFPKLYNTTLEVRSLATKFICITAACMPLCAFTHAAYFTLRSGGKTLITFVFDSVFVWGICVPIAFILSRFTDIDIVFMYLICQLLEIIKCIIGYIFIKKGSWLQNIVQE